MSIFTRASNAAVERARVTSKVKKAKKSAAKLPEDKKVVCFCYFCQSNGLLHRCREEAYSRNRYVILPDGSIQLVCNNHESSIPAKRKVLFLPESLSVMSIITKASE